MFHKLLEQISSLAATGDLLLPPPFILSSLLPHVPMLGNTLLLLPSCPPAPLHLPLFLYIPRFSRSLHSFLLYASLSTSFSHIFPPASCPLPARQSLSTSISSFIPDLFSPFSVTLPFPFLLQSLSLCISLPSLPSRVSLSPLPLLYLSLFHISCGVRPPLSLFPSSILCCVLLILLLPFSDSPKLLQSRPYF